MKRKTIALLGAFVVSGGMLAGCAGGSSSGDSGSAGGESADKSAKDEVIITMPGTSEPESGFDPAYGWGAGEHVHEPLIQSTLLTTTADLGIDKDLATDYKVSDDGLTWTVDIRNDVKFTNGKSLTAKDVAFTYNNCIKNNSVNDFTMLKEAVAVDEDTVEFRMAKEYSIWPYTMAIVGIVPEEGYDSSYGQHPIGSGRYILKQWDQGQQAIFEANPDYYGKEPNIKKLTVLFMDEDASLAAATAGKVDVAYTSATYSKETVNGYNLFKAETVDNRGFNLPAMAPRDVNGLTYGNAFTSDINVRRAINIGIDRSVLVNDVLNGYGTEAYSVCDGLPWYNPSAEVKYDLDGAKKLLDDAGWVVGSDGIRAKDGVRAEFILRFPTSDSVRQAMAENVVNQLKNLGIDVKTDGVGWDTAYDKAQSQAMMWGWGAHTPIEIYHIYHTASDSPVGMAELSPYKNETVDKYIDEALKAKKLEDSYDLWQKAQWDGTTGVTQQGDIPWIWLANIDHLYWAKDGINIAKQKLHPHGHGWSIVNNIDEWSWNK